MLTHEVREAVGSDRARVPADRADGIGRVHAGSRGTLAGALSSNRPLIVITFAMLLVVGVIVSLATGSWWAVVAAAGVHATGTLVVATVALRLTTEVEHVAPETAARLEEEGVADPDRALSDLIEQYAPTDQARGAAEVVSSGNNEVTTGPDGDRLRSGLQQRSALTPTSSPVGPAERGAPAALPIVAVAGSLLAAIVVAIVLGGDAWVLAVGVAAVSAGWIVLTRRMAGDRAEQDGDAGGDRTVEDVSAARRRRLVLTALALVTAVVAGVIVVGRVAGLL
jgi:hypothetical protein